MTQPRPRIPGERGMGTRRCTQRQMWLKPVLWVCQILGYVLGYQQARYDLMLHCAVAMSNHIHGLKTDREFEGATRSRISDFYRDFLSLTARALNKYWGRRENLWSGGGGRFNFVRIGIGDVEAALQQFVYVLTNPVVAGLVERWRQWPGLLLEPGPTGEREYRFKRYWGFFSQRMPKETVVRVVAPEFDGITRAEFMAEVYRRCAEVEERCRIARRLSGRKVLGVAGVLAVSPEDVAQSEEKSSSFDPQIKASTPAQRMEMLIQNREFVTRHHAAYERVRLGIRNAVFPYGTDRAVSVFSFDAESG